MPQKINLIPLKEKSVSEFKQCIPRTEKVLVFDIDSTLYSDSNGFVEVIIDRIHEYAKKKNIPESDIRDICRKYTQEYGLAVKGFCKHIPDTDPNEFDLIVDGGSDLSKYIKVDNELNIMLKNMNYRKYCFTNANYKHAVNVLNAMKLSDAFDGVFYCEYEKKGDFICKPDVESFKVVEDVLGVDPKNIVFYDDTISNIDGAKKRGWKAEQITVDYCIKKALSEFIKDELNKTKKEEESIIKDKVLVDPIDSINENQEL